MEYRRLGRSGLKVSEICLGTMTFGHGTDQAGAERIVHASIDAGVTFFDTADGYSNGESETILGRCLGTRRRDAVIATKVFNAMGSGPNDSGMSRVHIMGRGAREGNDSCHCFNLQAGRAISISA